MRHCLACDTPLKGRTDKKFCDYNCRNAHHNFKNRFNKAEIQKVHRALMKNYHILEELLQNKVESIDITAIQAIGFDIRLQTKQIKDPVLGKVSFLYDIPFQQNEEEIVLSLRELKAYRQTA